MPLSELAYKEAIENSKKDHAVWPETRFDKRFYPFVTPFLQPSFQIEKDDKIFCMGSCFARNIEKILVKLELDCVSAQITHRFEKDTTNFLIRYNPLSMFNELSWALNLASSFPKEALLVSPNGKSQDPHSNIHIPGISYDELVELRELVLKHTKKIA